MVYNIYVRIRNKIHLKMTLLDKHIFVGKSSTLFYKSKIINVAPSGRVLIGNKCHIGRSKIGYHAGMPFYTTIFNEGGKIMIGDNCRINGAYIHALDKIVIGFNCVIASGVNIIDSNGHETYSNNRTVGRDIAKEIIIGNNVWIGLNSTILKGTKIGDNCIISAGSVVKGNFPNNCIISGNPAIIVKKINI